MAPDRRQDRWRRRLGGLICAAIVHCYFDHLTTDLIPAAEAGQFLSNAKGQRVVAHFGGEALRRGGRDAGVPAAIC